MLRRGLNYVAVAGFKLSSNDPSTSAFWVAGAISMSYHTYLTFKTYTYICMHACMCIVQYGVHACPRIHVGVRDNLQE